MRLAGVVVVKGAAAGAVAEKVGGRKRLAGRRRRGRKLGRGRIMVGVRVVVVVVGAVQM